MERERFKKDDTRHWIGKEATERMSDHTPNIRCLRDVPWVSLNLDNSFGGNRRE
jgi:hypothetical protein